MVDFVMPSLGADMEAGTLVRWRKQPGESVKRGDIIAEVETDKGVIDIDVFANGVLQKILVPAGERVPVGTKLAIISNGEGTPPPADRPPPATPVATTQPAPSIAQPAAENAAQPTLPASPAHVEPRTAISPSARRRARELGIEIADLRGTGRHGAINREDVERAATAKSASRAAPAAASSAKAAADAPQQRIRQAIAAAMAKSKREIPHYYLSTTIDMQPAMNWLAETNELRPIADRLIYGVLLLKSVALALRELPEFNALWDGTKAVARQDIHIGVAIALREGGLIAPAIHNADRLSLGELMAAFRDLVKRARGGGLRSSELADSTITVTSLGDQGVESVQGVIYPPQVALVGFGKVVERPWCINGGLFARQVMIATLAADHRVSDGHRGGLLLNRIDQLLQEPGKL
jgi:pyruvate dehydrogenase E2 component (dihydrolipoamide acetyltransferase)